mgnify:CR=1 FL=1
MSKYNIKNDPNRQSEAQKYENPIPSREVILKYLEDLKYPTTIESVADALEIEKKSQFEGLINRLGAMVRDGQLTKDKVFYSLVGYVSQHFTSKVRSDRDGRMVAFSHHEKKEIAIFPSHARMLFVGDEIAAKISGINKKGRLEAEVTSIVKRNTHTVTGYYHTTFDSHFLTPVSKNKSNDVILLPPKEKIEHNSLVEAKILIQPTMASSAVGKFVKTVEEMSPVQEAMMIASEKYDLTEEWSKDAVNYLNKIPNEVALDGRVDLRDMNFVTIDGEDAKDFDDAVYATKTKSGSWKLYVAIADVSSYVAKDSALDIDARKRSTSVYFPGYVIPMLPEKLSNGLCSLQPNVDRYSLVCEMNVSASGKLSRYKFYSAVINSKARLTYNEVAKLLNSKDNTIIKNTPDVVPGIFSLHDLYKILRKSRDDRGAIDFDTVETQIITDEHNHIESIVPRHRNDAHKLIEECMLLANVATAKFMIKHKKTSPFRVHSKPKEEKMLALKKYLGSQGIHMPYGKDGSVTPQALSDMLASVKDRKNFDDIQIMTLRSMNQAIYSIDNDGHFGLAYKEYTHFTSPIRRYPDLVVHRLIKSIIKEHKYGGSDYKDSELANICDNASSQERNADGASKQVERWLKCYFMKDYIGQTLDAHIAHINGLGIFAELKDMYIDGLIHVSAIKGDYYVFDEANNLLIGRRTKKVYKIGQEIKVRVVRADLDKVHIDFDLVKSNTNAKDESIADTENSENVQKKKNKKRPRRKDNKNKGRRRKKPKAATPAE